MSQLDRRTGIKHLRVRGMKAVRFAATTMKAAALNIIRAAAYKKRRNKGKSPSTPSVGGRIDLIWVIKEHFYDFFWAKSREPKSQHHLFKQGKRI